MTESEDPKEQPGEREPDEQAAPEPDERPDYGHDEERYEPDHVDSDQIADPARGDGQSGD